MPTFADLAAYTASVTAKLTKPRRGVSGSEGVLASDVLSALVDCGTFLDDRAGTSFVKAPKQAYGSAKGFEFWASGGATFGFSADYLEGSIKSFNTGGSAPEMELWNVFSNARFSFKDGGAKTERFRLAAGNAWLNGKMHVGGGADRTTKSGALNVTGNAFVYGGGYYMESASNNGLFLYNTSDANRMGYVTVSGDGDFTNRFLNVGSNSSYYGVRFQNSAYEFARFTDSGVFLLNKTTDNGLGKIQVTGSGWFSANVISAKGVFGSGAGAAYALNVAETTANDVAASIENRSILGYGLAINSYANDNKYILNLSGNNGTSRFWFSSNGSLGIGTVSPDARAILDLTSTDKGLLVPRLTTTQRDAQTGWQNGSIIYNTTVNVFQGRANGAWVNL